MDIYLPKESPRVGLVRFGMTVSVGLLPEAISTLDIVSRPLYILVAQCTVFKVYSTLAIKCQICSKPKTVPAELNQMLWTEVIAQSTESMDWIQAMCKKGSIHDCKGYHTPERSGLEVQLLDLGQCCLGVCFHAREIEILSVQVEEASALWCHGLLGWELCCKEKLEV